MQAEIRLPGMQSSREASILRDLTEDVSARGDGGNAARKRPAEHAEDTRVGRARSAREDGTVAGLSDQERHTGAAAQKRARAREDTEEGSPAAHADADGAGTRPRKRVRWWDEAAGDGDATTLTEATAAEGGSQPQGVTNPRKRRLQSYDETVRRGPRQTGRPVYLERRANKGACRRRAIVMATPAIEQVVRGRYEWRDGGLKPTTGARKRFWDGEDKRAHDQEASRAGPAGDGQVPHIQG